MNSQCTVFNQQAQCFNGLCCAPTSGLTTCSNGGTYLGISCVTIGQCTTMTTQPATCSNGICCTIPQPVCIGGGQNLGITCMTSANCIAFASQPSICVNGICCTTTNGSSSLPTSTTLGRFFVKIKLENTGMHKIIYFYSNQAE